MVIFEFILEPTTTTPETTTTSFTTQKSTSRTPESTTTTPESTTTTSAESTTRTSNLKTFYFTLTFLNDAMKTFEQTKTFVSFSLLFGFKLNIVYIEREYCKKVLKLYYFKL